MKTYGYALWSAFVGGWLISPLVLTAGLIIKLIDRKSKGAQDVNASTPVWDEISDEATQD